MAGRRGEQRALLAVAHSLLPAVYHLLRDPALDYCELGENYFDKRDAEHTAAHLVKRLRKLGYEVNVTKTP